MKKFQNVLTASKSDSILAVIENLPVSANGYFLTEEQMTAIDAALGNSVTLQASVDTLTTERNQAQADAQTHQTALTTANATIDGLNTRIAAYEKMEQNGGLKPAPVAKEPTQTDANPWAAFRTSADDEMDKLKQYAGK